MFRIHRENFQKKSNKLTAHVKIQQNILLAGNESIIYRLSFELLRNWMANNL